MIELPVPVVKIVALGASGAGKTVLLASMFHELHVDIASRGYFFDSPDEQRLRLSSLLQQIIDPGKPWPPGTSRGDTREFTFACTCRLGDEKIAVVNISYLDYAGEFLEIEIEAGSEAFRNLMDLIKGAHALIGIFDGRRVLQYLNGEPSGDAYLHASVQPMIGIMNTTIAPSRPVYFVLTKWDLFREIDGTTTTDENARLHRVGEALMSVPQIRSVVAQHRVVRLIPVSAVGTEFGLIDPASYNLTKKEGGRYKPVNVDIPLAVVVPDILQQMENSIDARMRERINSRLAKMAKMGPLDRLRAAMSVFSRPAGKALVDSLQVVVPVVPGLVGLFLDWLDRPRRDIIDRTAVFRSDAERDAANLKTARELVLDSFRSGVQELETRLPACRLKR
jgi:GTPase SAR1 family protein